MGSIPVIESTESAFSRFTAAHNLPGETPMPTMLHA
jgi:hypothetical protein